MKFACTNYPLSAEKIDNYTDVIYKNETFSQSDRYYYTEYIRWNQLSPVIFDDIKLLIIKSKPLSLTPSIPLMYFGEHFSSLSIFPQDCSKYKFCEDCSTKEYTPGRKCHWCPKFDQCKHPRDFNVDTLLKQDCIIQQVESCPVSTSTPMPHISTDQLNDRPDEEIIKPVTSTTENATTGSQTNENTKSTLPLIMTDQSNQTDNYPTNNPTPTLPPIIITNQSSDNLMHNTTPTNVETTSSNPIKSNHPLLSRDIRQIYSITHINQVSMRFYFHLLMPFMIVAVVSIISLMCWLIKRRLRIVNFQIT
ncbi:unnamed protein product [Schistosoma turkestanicum]|nr:unnamed protein product [Schistosoma turkestanicum]